MKKWLASILAVIYIGFNIGATLHFHYCMGELASTSLFSLKDEKCRKCGMEKHNEESKDCCKDVSIVIKSGDDHTGSKPICVSNSFALTVHPVLYIVSEINGKEEPTYNNLWALSPPLLKRPLFIQYQNFRI